MDQKGRGRKKEEGRGREGTFLSPLFLGKLVLLLLKLANERLWEASSA